MMSKITNKSGVPVSYRNSDEKQVLVRASANVALHSGAESEVTPMPSPKGGQDAAIMLHEQTVGPGPHASDEIEKFVAPDKRKVKHKVETLEQLISHAYSRKGQTISLKPDVERTIAKEPRLDDDAVSRLLVQAAGDPLLSVPRQLLLLSREIHGRPSLRNSITSFVWQVIGQHPAFSVAGVQAALRNLPDAPSDAEALAAVVKFTPIEGGKQSPKHAKLQELRRNAAHIFVIWLASERNTDLDALTSLLFQAIWQPKAQQVRDENSCLRALTDLEDFVGVGIACSRFQQQAVEARNSLGHASREANDLRLRLAESEDQRRKIESQLDSLQTQLDFLREQTQVRMSEIQRKHAEELTHLRHGQEQLGGRLIRRLDDAAETLEVGLSALRNKTPRVEVMLERAELVVDALRKEIKNLRGD